MARTSQWVEVGKHRIELSNLDKVLFPDDGVLKAEIIEYYLRIAPTILSHIKGRPLTLVRFPDGIYGETFYQKNRPKWAPEWIDYQKLGKDDKTEYMLASGESSMVWLANLACLEMHQLHSKQPNLDKPDYIVYDLDPPEGYHFPDVVEIAYDLKEHIENHGYHTFVKTTGGKGLHVVTPIEPKWDFQTAFLAAKAIAQPFVDKHNKKTTLHIKKESRKGRVLIDIYRNRPQQSIISPYSLRGRPKAPVSMPVTWEDLESVQDPAEFNVHTALDLVLEKGDAWEAMQAYAIPLHTKKSSSRTAKDLGPSEKHKSPEQLKTYQKKRDFKKTPEPAGYEISDEGNNFVVHRHHASRLHYDLRLEEDGALKSWAVPRGMPPRPGIKRLAVSTEDHPMEYLTFEGKIPKGQYGGGDMWVYALGKYEYTKQKKDGFYFYLHSKQLNAEYRIYKTKDKEWLLERVDKPQIDYLSDNIEFMLASKRDDVPTGDEYLYEVKWDGIRALITLDEGELKILSRNKKDITHLFPELNIPDEAFRATAAVFDAEIVCVDEAGRPNFKQVVSRLHHNSQNTIERASKKHPAFCYIFDCLYLDGRPLVNETLERRREWLLDSVKRDTPYRVSEVVEEGLELFEATKKLELEGIMAKDRNSKYFPGKRSSSWYKVKVRNTTDCVILGFTEGKGDRKPFFGALQIAEIDGDNLVYRGKVGTGFDVKSMKKVHEELLKINETDRMIKEKPLDNDSTTWIEPVLFCEIQYASITRNNTYREPVFIRRRPDLDR